MNLNHKKALAGKALVDTIVQQVQDEIAENIAVLDLSDVPGSSVDWFIICDGTSTVHCQAIFDRIFTELKQLDTPPWVTEGVEEGRWILMDYSDVVVHIMLPELRDYYDLESLWTQGRRLAIASPESSQ